MMWPLFLMLAGGIAGLYFGAELLVKGAAGLARAMGMAPLVVGLTVVAYGTSAPELVVSLVAALENQSAIVLGNVVGSNIANLGLILGITALIAPPPVEASLIRREVPIMIAAAAAIPLLLLDRQVGRIEGGLLVLGALAFTWWTLRAIKRPDSNQELAEEMRDEVARDAGGGSRLKLAGMTIAGLGVLIGGGKLFVDGASALAIQLGMSERLVGLTIVAVGTSLPELAASLVAAMRGHSALAVGNVVGSNIFNVLFILGVTGTIHPVDGDLAVMRVDLIALGAFT